MAAGSQEPRAPSNSTAREQATVVPEKYAATTGQVSIGAMPPELLDDIAEFPPPSQGAATPPTGGGDLLALLRNLRAEAQDLRRVIELVQAGSTTLEAQNAYLTKTRQDLQSIKQQLAVAPMTHDTVRHLLNVLEQLEGSPLLPPPAEPLAAQAQTNAIVLILAYIRRIELLVGLLTIPSRLNDWLKHAKPGYYVPFHLVFQDEIPDDGDRQTVLNHLAWNPKTIMYGIVDVSNGLVFRYNEDTRARARSIGWLASALLVSLLIVLVMSALPISLPSVVGAGQRAATFLVGWLAVIAGVIAHIGVEGAKREQATRLPTILTVSDLGETIDARLGQIIWKLVLVLVGLFAVAYALDPALGVVNAFLVGYSLDSVVGVLGGNLETKVKAVEDRLRKP